ncbi:CHAT domain-containing protein [Microcoleus sp. FACHB-831]|uniref:CHAT domain-containing protein n=1 Tax=Microcoleus sp. FACHB-831 TaxID=2692827 RepID=UPI001684F3D0|nr:tetratricopeptide repeat protein [Microcoleus sp. FACHB-831]MBD1922851.1 CHAT domain-containing protein [Microcoleus sp. FACHB-831]
MDENRLAAYWQLIQKLLECPNGEEVQILNAHTEILDPGLLQTIIAFANLFEENGNQTIANRLTNLSLKMGKIFGSDQQQTTIRKQIADILLQWGIKQFYISQFPLASQCWEECLIIYKAICDRQGEANSLGNLGSAYDSLGHFGQALDFHKQSLNIKREIKDRIGEAISLIGLGSAYNSLGQFEQALDLYKQSLKIFIEIKDPQREANSLGNLGSAYDSLGQFEQALDLYKQSLAIFREIKDRKGEGNSLQSLGNVYLFLGKFEQAISYQEKSLEIKREIKDRKGEAASLGSLGNVYLFLGKFEQAISYQEESLEIKREIKDRKGEAASLGSLGNAYDSLGQFERAISYHEKSLAICKEIKDRKGEAASLGNLGNTYYSLGQFERAVNFYEQYLSISQQIKDRQGEANSLGSLGNAYRSLEKFENSLGFYQKSLTIFGEIKSPQGEGNSLGNLGIAYRSLGQFERAIEFYEQSLVVKREIKNRQGEANTLNNIGYAYYKSQQTEKAIENYRDSLKIAIPETMPVECFPAGRNLGNLGFTQGNWHLALEGYEPAMQAVEKLRKGSTTDKRRKEIIKEAISVYANAVQCYINLKQYDKAVETADRSRSRHLADLFYSSKDLYPKGEIPPEVEEYYRLQQQSNRLRSSDNEGMKALAATPQPTPNGDAIIEKIKELEVEKQQAWLKIRSKDEVLAGQLQPDPLSFEDMQKLIPDAETAILNFYTTGEHTHIFILRQNQLTQLHTCEGQGYETLQNWILNNWLIPYKENPTAWQNKIVEFLSELANRLQLKKLIEKHLKDIKELIIIPHLSLHQIPFAAVPLNDIPIPQIETASDKTRGRKPQTPPSKTEFKTESKTPPQQPEYLSDKFRLRIVPSCQILNFCHQRGNLKPTTMGIVENATGDLVCAGYECETLATMHEVTQDSRLQYQQATIGNYQNLLDRVQVLHSSHHAESDLNNSLESKLHLFDGDINLGRIFTWRFLDLADVFLSCCETNLTLTQITDDPLSIASGFLCAGARNVVSTLWAVDELPTALFCILYYQEKKYHSRSEALRKAQFKLRNLTGDELSGKYKRQLEDYFEQKETEENATEIIKLQGRLKSLCQKNLPFVSPHYWAGFVSQGLA